MAMSKMGAPIVNDKRLAAEVRRLGLNILNEILLDKENLTYEKEYRLRIIEKLAPSLLPRLNEHSGPDGGAIEVKQITGMSILTDGNTVQNENSPSD